MKSDDRKTIEKSVGSKLTAKQKQYYLELYKERHKHLKAYEFYSLIQDERVVHAQQTGRPVPKLKPFMDSLSERIAMIHSEYMVDLAKKMEEDITTKTGMMLKGEKGMAMKSRMNANLEYVRQQALGAMSVMLQEITDRLRTDEGREKMTMSDLKLVSSVYQQLSHTATEEERTAQAERKIKNVVLLERRRLMIEKQVAEMQLAAKRSSPNNAADYQEATILDEDGHELGESHLSDDYRELLDVLGD